MDITDWNPMKPIHPVLVIIQAAAAMPEIHKE
jgi:hypothetical protein